MARDKKDKGPPKGETPFQRFERLAKALVAVPKERIRDREDDVSEKR